MTALNFAKIVSRPAANEEAGSGFAAARLPVHLTRSQIVDAATRLIARRGDHRVPWPTIAVEACGQPLGAVPDWLDDAFALIDQCYARTAQALADSLLRAETAPGTALDKMAAFLVAALEERRHVGTLLSFRRGRNLPDALQRRLHERDMMVRTRLKRLLEQGRRDGSLARRNPDSACELILATLMVPDVAVTDPEQLIWDSELVELLLAALAEPHPSDSDRGLGPRATRRSKAGK
jgi:DNA-binding transcriptional regulator YbjK